MITDQCSAFLLYLQGLLNPFMLILTSETILKYYCPEGLLVLTSESFQNIFVQKGLFNPFMLVLTSETILKCFHPEGLLVLTSESILDYFCPEGFAQYVHACFVLRNYFRTFLSRRVCSIHSNRTCLEEFTQSVHGLLCLEGITQTLRKSQLLKISL